MVAPVAVHTSVTVGRRADRVVLMRPDGQGLRMAWEIALSVGREICYKARGVRPAERESFGPAVVRELDGHILVEDITGDLFIAVPSEVAGRLGAGIIAKAHELETEELHDAVSYQQAVLRRRGINLGLTNNPDIQAEAAQRAAWDSDIRRYIPSSGQMIQGRVFAPTVKQHEAKG